jgi:mannose-6-phosphate isomerase
LEGVNVELMANSDNVLRGGLTRKRVDVPELLQALLFTGERPGILNGSPASETETVYATPATEFELSRFQLPPTTRQGGLRARSAECLLVVEGELQLQTRRRHLHLQRGEAAFIPVNLDYTLQAADAAVTAFRASVPGPLSPP